MGNGGFLGKVSVNSNFISLPKITIASSGINIVFYFQQNLI